MNDKGLIAPYLASSSVNLFKLENKNQFSILRDLNSTKMYDFLTNTSVLVTLFSNLLTFDINREILIRDIERY